jgi:hypothetical protein
VSGDPDAALNVRIAEQQEAIEATTTGGGWPRRFFERLGCGATRVDRGNKGQGKEKGTGPFNRRCSICEGRRVGDLRQANGPVPFYPPPEKIRQACPALHVVTLTTSPRHQAFHIYSHSGTGYLLSTRIWESLLALTSLL